MTIQRTLAAQFVILLCFAMPYWSLSAQGARVLQLTLRLSW